MIETRLPQVDQCATRSMPRLALQNGRGVVNVDRVNGRSIVTRAFARSPLRLLTPRRRSDQSASVFTSTFGGGLLGGDVIDLDMTVGAGASCTLSTQASTKVYRTAIGAPATQLLRLDIGQGALCAVTPDPLTCFAGAMFEQRIEVDLAATGSLLLLDWLTSGRYACGERWAFSRYSSRMDIRLESHLIFRDAIRLDPVDGPIVGEHRMGSCNCYAVVLLLGPRVRSVAAEILAWAGVQPVTTNTDVIFAASPVRDGVVMRIAGMETQAVGRWIRERLIGVSDQIGARL